ncbi:MAG: hypothetical protein H6765_07360 [Candidatus Peribacteria bacterium]|nr:MAG: hypothetical protein H6765_07360 [Candidatus Peribacteria bacterium]
MAQNFKLSPIFQLESLPYAPTNSVVIGEHPVAIGAATLSYKQRANITVWQSVDPFGKSGDYTALFANVRIPAGKITVVPKFAHFVDWKFQQAGVSIFSVELQGGNTWKWSTTTNTVVFHGRSPRWVQQGSLSRWGISLNGWYFLDQGVSTVTAGLAYATPTFPLSEKLQGKFTCLWNESISRLTGQQDGYGQEHTVSLQFTVSRK